MSDARVPADATLFGGGNASNAESCKPVAALYAEHVGKVSDKWSAYLHEYDRIFQGWRDKPVRILEIGVQNGGSLEIWAKAFPNGKKFIGCDINSDCAYLTYQDPRITLVIGDANSDAAETEVRKNASTLDIIIDDGSHRSGDIIRSFARYFPHLSDHGVYIVEDLHCSYWQEFEGGLYFPFSAMAFFKRLADIINHEHWKIRSSHADVLKGFFAKYDFVLSDEHLSAIHSVEFTNSVCVIRKHTARHHGLKARVIAGKIGAVQPGTQRLMDVWPGTDQTDNEWTARSMPPEEELALRLAELAERDGEIAALRRVGTEQDIRVEALCRSVGERDARIVVLDRAVAERDDRIDALCRAVGERDHKIAGLDRAASDRTGELVALNRIVAEREAYIADLKRVAEERNQQIAALNRTLGDKNTQLAAFYASTSWRLTAPLRFARLAAHVLYAKIRAHLSRTARAAYRRAPLPAPLKRRIKNSLFRNAAPLFRHTIAYRDWRSLRRQQPTPEQPAMGFLTGVPHRSTDGNLFISSSVPKVSAIVPNYNHARFLRERFASIATQRLSVSEIIILDDASTDDSRDVIAQLAAGSSIPVRTVFNDTNSGNVFKQWAKGIALAECDLIWICESDDTCDRGFLDALVPYFQDQSVMLAFGWVDFIEADGSLRPGMDKYMEGAAPGAFWQAPRIAGALTWFQGPFGIRNVIPNVAGCIFRRTHINSAHRAELTSYRVCGDWYLYSRIAHRGRIAYDPSARTYFRQHRGNTSVSSFHSQSFHEEHIRIALALRRHYGSDAETLRKMLAHVCEHYRSIFGDAAARDFARRHPLEPILAQRRTIPHVLVAMYGFQTGGGEVFPILLANEISRRGYDVSVLVSESERVNAQMRKLLAAEIPVFTTAFVEKMGAPRFFNEFGVDLIHTHNVGIDMWLHWQCKTMRTPYIVTHHGSYECVQMTEALTKWLLANVDHWVYIADKNLAFMNGRARDASAFTKLPNAVPHVEAEFPISRKDLGIEPDAFVFGLASRAIRSKGWDIAIHALKAMRRETARRLDLVLCGDGEDLDALKAAHGDEPGVHFLGYQEKIQAFYRWCDCCILPTRFVGESYPLTIIEAILAGIPTIATDVGEIRSMLNIDREPMGVIVPPHDNDAVFGESIRQAMWRVLDGRAHETLRSAVMKNRNMFSMDNVVDNYMAIYQRVLGSARGATFADLDGRKELRLS